VVRFKTRFAHVAVIVALTVVVAPLALESDNLAYAAPSPAASADGPALDPDEANVDGERLVLIPADGVSQDQIEQKVAEVTNSPRLGEADLDGGGQRDVTMEITTSDVGTSQAVADELVNAGLVEAVDYGFTAEPMYAGNPNDPALANQYAYFTGAGGANFQGAWPALTVANQSSMAPIADIDTGFQMNHPDAQCGQIVAGYNYGDNNTNVNPTNMGSDGVTYHGTATAGLMGGCTNNGTLLASAGWDQKVIVYKVSSASTQLMTDTAIINSIYAAVDTGGARVINMSLGFTGTAMPSNFQAAVDYAISKNVVVVASAGNYGNTSINGVANPVVYPAAYAPVISVAATNSAGAVASFSTYNSAVDIAAPGVSVATFTQNSWAYQDGTSFSAPLVATAAAIVLRLSPSLTPAQVASVLTATAKGNGSHNNNTGYGILNVQAALAKLGDIPPTPPPPPIYIPSMSQIILSPDLTGDGRADVVAVRASDGGLLVFPGLGNGRLGSPLLVGTGFQGVTMYAPGDWNGDRRNDLLGMDAAGNMYLFAGRGNGYLTNPVQIGHGWSAYNVIPSGDLTSDGNPDLLAVNKSSGDLFLYAGNGKGGFKSPYPKVGYGWLGFQLVPGGDLTGDGKADILGIDPDGYLFLYAGNGKGGFSGKRQVGHGWNAYALIGGADLNGDRINDVLGRDNATGILYFYPGKKGGGFTGKIQVGAGW